MERGQVEFVVVGAGVLGLSAARALARRGREVQVCEQAHVGHDGGGSKGSARIFRLGYDDPAYIGLALASAGLWRELEDEAGTRLLTTTGQVTFGADLGVLVDAMAGAGAPYEEMPGSEVSERFPALAVPTPAVFEPASGVLAADACLAALRRSPGIELREGTRVLHLEDDGRRPRLLVEDDAGRRQLVASGVVVCAGPWTAPLVSGVGVAVCARATLEQVVYLEAADDGAAGSRADVIPVVVERRRPWFYALPVPSTGLAKVSLHGAGPVIGTDALDEPQRYRDDDPALVAELLASARRVLPGLDRRPRSTERCLYDNAPGADPVLDRRGRVVVGSGTSGHGFKFAPLLGELLADLATGVTTHADALASVVDVGRFSADR